MSVKNHFSNVITVLVCTLAMSLLYTSPSYAKKNSIQSKLKVAKSLGSNSSSEADQTKAQKYFDEAMRDGGKRVYGAAAEMVHDSKKAYYYQLALATSLDNPSYLEKVSTLRDRLGEGPVKIIGLKPGVYARNDLLFLARKAASGHAGAKEYIKDFMRMGYIKSVDPVQLLTLSNGFNAVTSAYDESGRFLYFSDDKSTLTLTHNFSVSIRHQSVNSTWDTKTGELIRLRVLGPFDDREAISKDGRKFAIITSNARFWKSSYDGEKVVAIIDGLTGRQLMNVTTLDEHSLVLGVRFLGDGKYLSVSTSIDRSIIDMPDRIGTKIYDTQTGGEITEDVGEVTYRISPDGLRIVTTYRESYDQDYPNIAIKHQRLPKWSGGTELKRTFEEKNKKISYNFFFYEMDTSIFSPDSQYWITPTHIYDLNANKDLGEHGAAHNTSVAFQRIPKTNLLVRVYDDAIDTYAIDGSFIVKISSAPMDIKWDKRDRTYLFSADFTKIAIRGVRADSTKKEIYIQSYEIPDREKIQEQLTSKKSLDDAMKLFEAGFDAQAITKLIKIISKNPLKVKYSLDLMRKREVISATAIGEVILQQSKLAREHKKRTLLGVIFKSVEHSTPGKDAAIVERFSRSAHNFIKAGGKIGDRVLSINGQAFFFENTKEMKSYLKSIGTNDTIQVIVERNGQRIALRYAAELTQSIYGMELSKTFLFWYGLMANAAGHPDIAVSVAQRIEQLDAQYPNGYFETRQATQHQQMVILLRAIALAKKGEYDDAYNLLLASSAMKDKDNYILKHLEWYPDLFVDLYKEPKKLAYILNKKAEDLPKVKDFKKVKKADFWTLDGRLIKPGESAEDKSAGGKVIE